MHTGATVSKKLDKKFSNGAKARFFIYSLIGIFCFFVNIEIGGNKTILYSHVGEFIIRLLMPVMPYLILITAIIAVVDLLRDFKGKTATISGKVFSLVRILALAFSFMAVFSIGPAFLVKDERIFAFIITHILSMMIIYIPLASLLLPLLLDSGLVEFIGTLIRPIMRPIFKVPGRSAVIAITAYFSSNAVGIFAIDRMYKEGKFTAKEAVLLSTAFCTSAISFVIIVAGVAGVMPYWNLYFIGTFLVLFACAIVQVRIWPVRGMPDTCYQNCDYDEEEAVNERRFKTALNLAYETAENMQSMVKSMIQMLKLTLGVLSTVIGASMVFATLGLLLVYHTPIFEYIGYIFYPFAALLQLEDPHLVSVGAAAGLVDPMTPAILGAQSQNFVTKFVLANIPITAIIGAALTIPVYFSTSIPIKFWHMIVIWIERVICTIIFSALIGYALSALFL